MRVPELEHAVRQRRRLLAWSDGVPEMFTYQRLHMHKNVLSNPKYQHATKQRARARDVTSFGSLSFVDQVFSLFPFFSSSFS
jgi:hypothetical protein